jgi:hypothetical protein
MTMLAAFIGGWELLLIAAVFGVAILIFFIRQEGQ